MVFTAARQNLRLFIPRGRDYLTGMSGFFFTAMIIAMLATLGILVTGIVSMGRGGEFNAKYGNKLMRARVMMQGIALLFFALALMTAGK
jgi:hypothetical protein